MLFNSIEFAFFFPIVSILFFALPHRYRWLLLLTASCFFYMFFKPIYILILGFTILIDYYAAILISNQADLKRKRLYLLLSILANVGVMAVFKYFNFLALNFNLILESIHSGSRIPLLEILLPIGLSFHTFQAMSYTIEVYRGNQVPERHFGIYALYVMFYPQLVAGPIERPQNILHQFHEEQKFNYDNARCGLILIAWGLFKKVVVADRLSLFVNEVYGSPHSYTGIPLLIATAAFAFQIFCDFSGYSDIAIGSARFMGFNLMTNFDRPYMSTTVGEFWRRWHISLSTWFRDYVYIPLGGNRVRKSRWYFNLLIVFLLSGLWHGANWTFIVWGLLHGLYVITETALNGIRPSLFSTKSFAGVILRRTIVFVLVCVAWVFFRAVTMDDALYIVQNIFSDISVQIKMIISNEHLARLKLLYLRQSLSDVLAAIFFLFVLMIVHHVQRDKAIDEWIVEKSKIYRWSFYYAIVIVFVLFGVFNKSGFIYFQF